MQRNTRTSYLAVVAALPFISLQAQAQTFQYDWAGVYASSDYTYSAYNCGSYSYPSTCYSYYYANIQVAKSAYDGDGNVVTGGTFTGTFDANPGAGTTTLSPYAFGYQSSYISKLSSSGGFVWAKQFTAIGSSTTNGLAVDASGNTIAVMRFNGSLDVDPGPATTYLSASSYDLAIIKLDISGNLVWAKQLPTTNGGNTPNGLAVDGNGNIYISGYNNGTSDFDGGVANTATGIGGYFAKYNSNGDFQWVRLITSAASVTLYDIELDQSGDVVVAGNFSQNTDVDPGAASYNLTPSNPGFNNCFFAKYDNSGNFLWAKQLSNTTNAQVYNPVLRIDNGNNILLAAYYYGGNIDMDPGANSSFAANVGNYDVFLAKYDVDGNFSWGKSIGGGSTEFLPTLAIDGNNNTYITFYSYSTFDADDGPAVFTLTNHGGPDILSIEYDETGAFKTAMDLGTSDSDVPLTSCAHGNKYFFGGYKYSNSNLDFDPGPNTTTNTFYYSATNGVFAQYTVSTSAEITADPSNLTVCEGLQSNFIVTATGSSLSYKWQVYTGSAWADITNDETYSGATTAKLTISSTPVAFNNYQYRCIVTPQGGSDLTSGAATLTVNALPNITGQPVEASICLGQNTTFTVAATGAGISYQWQVNTGAGWGDISNIAPYSNANTNTLSLTNPPASFNNYQYRCLVNGTCTPQAISDAVKLTVNTSPSITAQTGDKTICDGGNTTFSVTASGAGTIYQWQIGNGEGGFTDLSNNSTYSGVTANELTISDATLALSGKQYRSIVSGTCTPPVSSTAATLTVRTLPTASILAGAATICSGTSTVINFTGTPTARISYTINGGDPQTIDLNSEGLASVGTGNLASTATYSLVSAQYIDATTCSQNITGQTVVTVKSLPSATISGTTTLCSGTGSNISFNGTPGTTVGYTVNSSSNTIDIGVSGSASVPTGILTATTTYALTNIQYTDAPGCVQSSSGNAVVTVNPIPGLNQPLDIIACNNQNISAAFTGTVNGSQFDWINDNTYVGLSSSGTGNIPSFNAVNGTNAPITATIIVTPKYTNNAVTCTGTAKTFTITVNPTPSVVQPSVQTVCNGSSNPGTTLTGVATSYSWTNDAPTIGLASSGTGNIPSFNATNSGTAPIVATITVTPYFATGDVNCTGTAKTYTITVYPTTTVNSISDRIHCNADHATAINFSSPVVGTTYSWTSSVDVGFGTSGNGNIATYLATNNTNAPVTSTISVTPTANGCTGTVRSFTVAVNPTPTANSVTNQNYCNGDNGNAVTFGGPVTGTSYQWTSSIDVGFGTSGTGNIQQFKAANNTTVPLVTTVTITPAANGCTGTPITFTITVNPTATVNSIGNRTHCNQENGPGINFSGPVGGTTFAWTSTANIGFGTSGNGNIAAYVASNNTNAPITTSVTVTPTANGCTGTPITFTVTVNPTPTAYPNLNSQTVCSGTSITPITFTGDVTNTVYHWTRNNTTVVTGIAASGDGPISGVLSHTSAMAQAVTFTITPEANGCLGVPITATVTVNPLTYISTQPVDATQFALENTSFTVSATGTAPVTYKWQVNPGTGWGDLTASSIYSGQATPTLTLTGVIYAMNNYQYRCVVTGTCSTVTSTAVKLTVVKRPTTLTYSGDASEQYSDVTDVKAQLIDQRLGTAINGKTVNFTLGSQNATAPTNTSGFATSTITVNQDPAPSYNIVSNFSGDDTYAASSDSDPFDITQENARVDYTGIEFNATPCATCLSQTVLLQATVQDISVPTSPADPLYDANSGDIRNAWVKFINKDNGTDISSWIPVSTLLYSGDLKTATVQFPYTVTLGSNEDSRQVTVGIVVNNGYYVRNDPSDNTVVTIYKPSGESVNGGGFVRPTASSGVYSSDLSRRMNFGLNVKYTKNGSQPKGSVNMIFRRTVGNTLHTYQIKSNSISTVGIGGTNAIRRGQFVSKANLTDISNPMSPVSLGGNLSLTVTMTDEGEPGDKDSIGVTLYGSDGSLWYSSNWITSKTKELAVQSGNVVINSSTFAPVVTMSTVAASRTDSAQEQPLNIKVLTNPTSDQFKVIVSGKKNLPIQLSVVDMGGKHLYGAQVVSGQLVQFGNSFTVGTYIIQAMQGSQNATTKVIKH
jgi:trimeric autotransporter adhesin